MPRALHRFLVPALALALQTPMGATVIEEHARRTYPVPMQPGQSLRQALHAATPIETNGQRYHGHTRWNVRWNYRWWREPSGRCRITEVTTRLHSEVQLPAMEPPLASQQAAAHRYLAALTRHEEGHVQIGRDAARAIDHAIAALPQAQDCATLEREANALGHRLLREHAEREKAYDQRTRHGETQGAVLE